MLTNSRFTRSPSLGIITDHGLKELAIVDHMVAAGYQVSFMEEHAISSSAVFPDLLLINYSHSEVNGLEVIQKIRKFSCQVGVVVVITHGHAQSNTLAFNAGADNCIHSPYDPREMLVMMASLLRRVMLAPSTA